MPGAESIRAINKIWKSEPTIEGAGVHLKRAFGFHNPGEERSADAATVLNATSRVCAKRLPCRAPGQLACS